jgi:hypothetical protein
MYDDSGAFFYAAYYATPISVLSNTNKMIDMLSTGLLLDVMDKERLPIASKTSNSTRTRAQELHDDQRHISRRQSATSIYIKTPLPLFRTYRILSQALQNCI